MKEVLLVTIGFSPNIGGIETHFDDLVSVLDKRGWRVWVLTYKPITTNVWAPLYERRGKNINIYRIPWFRGLFYRLVQKPALEFLFLTPGLFFTLPILLLLKARRVKTIHSHGLISGFVSVFWGKIFGKKVISTTHSIYNFPQKGVYRNFAKWIFSNAHFVLGLSNQAVNEIKNLGVNPQNVGKFTYWVDLRKFKRIPAAKQKLGWNGKFVAFFVGRLVPEKGVRELLDASKLWNRNITLAIVGSGPLELGIRNKESGIWNLKFLGRVDNEKLPLYYSAADVLIVPSTHEEGFGRVILESLACGTPVIGARRGAIPEAMDETVGRLIEVNPRNIKEAVEYFYKNPKKLEKLSKNARKFALRRYSEKNVEKIIKAYELAKT